MKKILRILNSPAGHWVGNGFPVRSLFSYNDLGRELSPFLLLDYAGPRTFAPAHQARGVGPHPHRGFETVTIVYAGEVAHRDSAGHGGVIGPGDVQWMTLKTAVGRRSSPHRIEVEPESIAWRVTRKVTGYAYWDGPRWSSRGWLGLYSTHGTTMGFAPARRHPSLWTHRSSVPQLPFLG